MKIALAQLNYHIGNFELNVSKIKNAIAEAKEKGADLAVFAELAICGYPPRDFLEFEDFILLCKESIAEIAKECNGIAAIVGGPSVNPKTEGKDLLNSAYFLADGEIKSIHSKALLPTYDVFDEYRYFEPAKEFSVIEYKGHKIALTICEDIWDERNSKLRKLYTKWPMDKLIKQQPNLMVNISASPFHYGHAEERREIMISNAKKYSLPVFYCNHIGAQTELIFDGGSMVMNSKGEIIDELNYFQEDLRIYEVEKPEISLNTHPNIIGSNPKSERFFNALVLGINNYFKKLGFEKAILGLSGGIDSAVALCLAVKALGKDNVLAVLMPSEFSSDHSVTDAKQLAQNIGCPYETIPIENAFHTFRETLKPHFKNLPFNVAEENIQARTRAVILMALANKFNYILLNTSNKSETSVGYGTLYGDMCGGLSPLGDVYKTEVYELAAYINQKEEVIPKNIIEKPPSAELRPNQQDSDSIPEYDILDKILHQYIEQQQGPKEIIDMGFDEQLVRKVLKLVNTSEWKRHQTPPILRVSPKAFGMGRRMPIVGKYLS
ncbi:NAD+ synthase [Bacteroidales bacterium AH-315-I05]|nr:NAD+ synthase [Bacteroidales bacterium AH-315-I05]